MGKKKLIKTAHLVEEKPQIQQSTNLLQDSSSEESDQQENKKEKFQRFQIIDENKQIQGQLDRYLQKGKQTQTAPQPKKHKVIEFRMVEETLLPINQKEEEKRGDQSDDSDSDFDLPTKFQHLAKITRTSTFTTQATQISKVLPESQKVETKIYQQEFLNQFEQEHFQVTKIQIEEDSQNNLSNKPLQRNKYRNFQKYQREQVIQVIKYYGGYLNCRILQDTIIVLGDCQNNDKDIKYSHHLEDAKKQNSLILDFEAFNNHLISYTGNDLQKSLQLVCQGTLQNLMQQQIQEQQVLQSKQKTYQCQSSLSQSKSQQYSKLPTNQPVQEINCNLREKFDSDVVLIEKQVELKPEIVNFSKNKQILDDQKIVSKIEQIAIEETKQKCQLWTNKYAPSKVSDCLDQTHVSNIVKWLDKWGKTQLEICPGSFQSQNFAAKALLLSGPPGIGKTTIIRLIAKQKSYQLIEWNASDVRSMIRIIDLTLNFKLKIMQNICKTTQYQDLRILIQLVKARLLFQWMKQME